MDFYNQLLEMPLFLAILFLCFGILLYYFPPKKINVVYGYKTTNSMKSQQTWDFAQKFAAVKMWHCGILSVLVFIIEKRFVLNSSSQTILGFSILLFSIVYIIYFTEKAIKSKFPNT
jgi:uncharacterized membrane protein